MKTHSMPVAKAKRMTKQSTDEAALRAHMDRCEKAKAVVASNPLPPSVAGLQRCMEEQGPEMVLMMFDRLFPNITICANLPLAEPRN